MALSIFLASLGSLALAAAPASAKLVYAFTSSFAGEGTNALSGPTGVAVDNSAGGSAGSVYVTDPGNHRVEKFNAAGDFVLMFGKGVNQTTPGDVCPVNPGDVCQPGSSGSAAGQFDTPTFVAVDPSSGPSSGNVYVGDTATGLVQKFDSGGHLITAWGTGGQLSGLGEVAGVAVDPAGNLAVMNTSSTFFMRAQDGTSPTSFSVARGTDPTGLASDPTGAFFYKANGDNQSYEKFSSANADIGAVNNSGAQQGVAVNPATGDMFASSGTSIDRYVFSDVDKVLPLGGSSCTFAPFAGCPSSESFGSSATLNGARGLAVSGSSSKVYVANTGGDNVAVFSNLILADVDSKPDSDLTPTSVRVNAEVDPAGGPAITTCKVEYGAKADEYNLGTQPCNPDPASGSFTAPTAVSAQISNLTVLVPVHYRFVVTTTNGSSAGPDRTVISQPNMPAVERTYSSAVSASAATLNADIDPGFGLTVYRFDWGTSEAYGSRSLVGGPIDPNSSSRTASTVLDGLAPGTVYHFRVLATNFTGTVFGPDQTFVTPSPPYIAAASVSVVTRDSATLNAQIGPGLGLTTYHFEYGTSGNYGSRTAESAPIGPDDAIHAAAASLAGLAAGTTYHYRVVATNEIGTSVSPDQTFTTLAPEPSKEGGGKGVRCKKGFVKNKRGKCVRKSKPKRHKKQHKAGGRG